MYDKAVDECPWSFEYLPDRFKTQEMCNKAVDKYTWLFKYVPDIFKTQRMSSDKFSTSEEFDDILDWFITS